MLFIICLAWVNLTTLTLKQVLFCLSEDWVANQCNLGSIKSCNNTVYWNIVKLVLVDFNRQQTIYLGYKYKYLKKQFKLFFDIHVLYNAISLKCINILLFSLDFLIDIRTFLFRILYFILREFFNLFLYIIL